VIKRRHLYREMLHAQNAVVSTVCPSVRTSICPSVTFRYRDYTGWNNSKKNFTADQLKVYARADPNVGDLVQREHRQNYGGIRVGSRAQKTAIFLKRCKVGPKLL